MRNSAYIQSTLSFSNDMFSGDFSRHVPTMNEAVKSKLFIDLFTVGVERLLICRI